MTVAAPEPLSTALESDQPLSCTSSAKTEARRVRVYRSSWTWLIGYEWAAYQPISGFQISEFGINSTPKRRRPNHQPCRKDEAMNEKLFVLTTQKKKTNHILHVIMTVLTGGIWLIVWGLTMRSNDAHNKKLDKQINQIMLYKTQGLSDNETYKQIRNDELNSDVLQGRVIFVILVVVFLYFYLR